MAQDLYSVLGVSRTSDEDTIKKAYRKLASKLHPDKNPGSTNDARFKQVNRAFDVLGDKKKRALYDEFGEESLSGNFDADRARAFRQYQQGAPNGFGRGGFGRQGGVGPGGAGRQGGFGQGGFAQQDIFGGAGGGDFSDMLGDLFGRSRGAGVPRPVKGQDLESSVTVDFVSAVNGTTLQLRLKGAGSAPVSVRIPPGAKDGARLRLAGFGAPGANSGPAGDLLLEVKVTPHKHFRREDDDLYLDLPITITEAWAGAKVAVPTPSGEVNLKVPPKTQSGQVMRLRGKGVARKGAQPGDLYIKYLVHYPTTDSEDVEKAIATLGERCENPREGLKF